MAEFKKIGFVGIMIFAVLSQAFIIAGGRELWFDPAFSIETAHQLNDGKEINFAEHDVHPPFYYYALAGWMQLHPESLLSEYQWAQELSWLLAIWFLVALLYFLSEVFGRSDASIAVFTYAVVSSTLLYFASEARMYILLLAFVATFLFLATDLKNKWCFSAAIAIVALMPMIHYFSVVAFPFMFAIAYVVSKNELAFDVRSILAWVRENYLIIVAALMGLLVASLFAIPQRLRSVGTWYQPPEIASYPSSIFYSTFIFDNFAVESGVLTTLMYYGFLIFIVWAIWKHFKYISSVIARGEALSKEDVVLSIMFSTALLPLLALTALSLCGGGGFCNLYHHRLFLVATWMLPIAALITLARVKGTRWFVEIGIVIVIACAALSFVSFTLGAHHELEKTIAKTPCEPILIGHESPFSALPYKVAQRDNGCEWRHFISTGISVEASRTSGFDVIPESEVYWNYSLPSEAFVYVMSESRSFENNPGFAARVANASRNGPFMIDEGIWLMFVDPEVAP